MQSKSEFVLRRVTSEGFESDEILGRDYSKLYDDRTLDKKGDPIEGTEAAVGKKYFEMINHKGWNPDEVHMILVADFGTNVIPCYRKSKYFIMLNGATQEAIKSFV